MLLGPDRRIVSNKFQTKDNVTGIDKVVCKRCSPNKIMQFLDISTFFIYKTIFRHLKLEIALAIPASNDEKVK